MHVKISIRFYAVATIVLSMLAVIGYNHTAVQQTNTIPCKSVLIDAGHGGVDGGASAADGTLEKEINLAVAQDMYAILTFLGMPTEMIRTDDRSIHDDNCTTIRQKKVSDLNNRLKKYDAAAMVVSIHQNHFSVSKYSGAQVLYSPNHPQSQILAQTLRDKITTHLQQNNTREIKAATNSIFLLHHTKQPAVIVECGFLSNPSDSEQLKSPIYRQQLALSMAAGILESYS